MHRSRYATPPFKDLRCQNVHAIGDRANHIVLNIFEDMQSIEPGFVAEHRPRIEHSQIMTLGDLERSGRLSGRGSLHLFIT